MSVWKVPVGHQSFQHFSTIELKCKNIQAIFLLSDKPKALYD